MIELLPESEGNVLAFKVTGKLTNKDYKDVFYSHLEKILTKYGKARIVFYTDNNFQGWDNNTMWDDVRFGVTHRNDFEKVAIVGGTYITNWGTKLTKMLNGEVKCYPNNNYKEALNWTKAQPTPAWTEQPDYVQTGSTSTTWNR